MEGTLAAVEEARRDEEEMTNRNVAFASTQERETRYKEIEEKFGKCRLCHRLHTYERTVGQDTMTWPSCRMSSCPEFMQMTPEEKGKVIENIKGCPKCLSWKHQKKHCQRR